MQRDTRTVASRVSSPVFVGRADELRELVAAMARASAGWAECSSVRMVQPPPTTLHARAPLTEQFEINTSTKTEKIPTTAAVAA
jgi:hypothetical protein